MQLALLAATALCASVARAQYGWTERIDVNVGGQQADDEAWAPALSGDGRYVAYHSSADNLAWPNASDDNGTFDVFRHDRVTGTTLRISTPRGNIPGAAPSMYPSISADGTRVAFASGSGDFGLADGNQAWDVYVYDVPSDTFVLASVSSADVLGNGASMFPELSADGRFVVFESGASNFSPADTNQAIDVYRHDLSSGATDLVSHAPSGFAGNRFSGGNFHDGPSISGDGRFCAFGSEANDLVPGDTNHISNGPMLCAQCGNDVFVWDALTSSVTRVSVSSGGGQGNQSSGNPALSGDGRFVVFESRAANLVPVDVAGFDIFVHDRDVDVDGVFDEPGAISTRLVDLSSSGEQANSGAGGGAFGWRGPTLSYDGRRVAFFSTSTNLVAGDVTSSADVFVRDLATGRTECASIAASGAPSDKHAYGPALSADGSVCAFAGRCEALVAGDTNNVIDVFVRLVADEPRTYCTAQTSSVGCVVDMSWQGFAREGATSGFTVTASELLAGAQCQFLYSLAGGSPTIFHGATMCVQAPRSRTPISSALHGGSGALCAGSTTCDFNAVLSSTSGPAAGAHVWVQVWSRDPSAAHGTNLGGGLEFVIGPP